MNSKNLLIVRELIYKLIKIANKEIGANHLTPEEAKLTVKLLDLTEGYIRNISDEYVQGYIKKD